ncbi:MAG: UpxY family transcription antiterminator [Prevotella sp.]
MNTSITDEKTTPEGTSIPPRTGLTPDVLPEVQTPISAENSTTGVSTNYTQSAKKSQSASKDSKDQKSPIHWYALRATYGQESKANDYLVSKGVETYYPTIKAFVMVNNKRKKVTQSYLLNIFFARGTEDELKTYVYDNANLPYLRFYCRRTGLGDDLKYEPLIVPDRQLENLRTVLADQSGELVVVPDDEHKFDKGATVRVIGGTFKGIVGKVARYCGHQRVAIVVDGILTIATTYIPSAYLERIE